MTEALIVENSEAYALAHDLAERRGTSVADAVVAALRAYDRPVEAGSDLNEAQCAERTIVRALVREARAHRVASASTGHDDLYDEYGLPV